MSGSPSTSLAASSALAAAAAPRAPVTSRPPPSTPPPSADDEVAMLRAQLAAANADKAAAEARAAAAEAAKGQPGRITAQVKSVVKGQNGEPDKESKGGINIYGVNNKFPVTVYLQSLVKMVKAMKEDGIIHKAVRANMAHVSIRLPGKSEAVRANTPEGVAAVESALQELSELLGITE